MGESAFLCKRSQRFASNGHIFGGFHLYPLDYKVLNLTVEIHSQRNALAPAVVGL